jgi:hypothetical protein
MSASTHVVTPTHRYSGPAGGDGLDALHRDPWVRRDVAALLVLGLASGIVCATTSGWLALLTAVVALTTPIMGKVLLTLPATREALGGLKGRTSRRGMLGAKVPVPDAAGGFGWW